MTTSTYDACLKCGICDLHCPVLRVTPDFPGPRDGGPGAERLRAAGKPVNETGLDLCLGCRTCEVVCPSGLSPATLVHKPKVAKVRKHGLNPRDWLLTRSELLGAAGVRMPRLANGTLALAPIRAAMDKVMRLDRRRPMPSYPRGGTFRAWFARRPNPWRDRPAPNGQAVYFHGCSTTASRWFCRPSAAAACR